MDSETNASFTVPDTPSDNHKQPHHHFASTEPTSPTASVADFRKSTMPSTQLGSPRELGELANMQSVAVVKTLSVRGLEYLFMSICLWIGAAGLIWSLLLLVNGKTDAQLLAFPVTSLVVCGPIFAWFFIRLKKAELANPALRFDPSKRRTSQITQLVAFLTSLFNIITFVYLLIASTAGNSVISIGTAVVNLLVILAVAGGILAYYWVDEHRSFTK